jgi:hypothetical protein
VQVYDGITVPLAVTVNELEALYIDITDVVGPAFHVIIGIVVRSIFSGKENSTVHCNVTVSPCTAYDSNVSQVGTASENAQHIPSQYTLN